MVSTKNNDQFGLAYSLSTTGPNLGIGRPASLVINVRADNAPAGWGRELNTIDLVQIPLQHLAQLVWLGRIRRAG